MKYGILFLLIFVFLVVILKGQTPKRTFLSYELIDDKLEIVVSDGSYEIFFYSNQIVENTFVPKGGEASKMPSHAVVMQPRQIDFDLRETDSTISFITEGMGVIVSKSPFAISYQYQGREIVAEGKGYVPQKNGFHTELSIGQDEMLFGGGARVLGMNRRGNRLELYNRAHYGYETRSELMNYTMPMVLSSKKYAVHFDNPSIGFLDLDSRGKNTIVYETIGGRTTYQVVAGNQWFDVVNAYTELTGRQPMPPRWAFGNFSSRFGYHSEKEVRDVVQKFKEDSIPLDAVVIDIYWFGKDIQGHMGNLEFFADSFPTPDKMMKDFDSIDVKTILVSEPFILTTSKKWEEAVEKKILGTDSAGNPFTYDFYFGNTGLIDIYNPEGEAWFWDFYKHFTERGVGGWWGDLGEPEVHPSAMHHATGMADEVHNIYGHDWARLIFEGFQRDFPDVRPFILMRAGYSGSQRYGLIPWTGDVSRSWGGLQPQTEISLQMGLQGIGYMHSDLGGFAGGEVFDPELYTRWLQYGVFQPIFRPHAQEHIAPEPVLHDEATKALAKVAVEERYKLLPYIYTIAFENSRTGMPLMRPLFFEEPDNATLYEFADPYLWGDDFLVSPVTVKGQTQKKIYFPKGGNWFDFYSGEKYSGGQRQKINLVPWHIPVYVRGGSIIPMAKPMQNTNEFTSEELELHYYYDADADKISGRFYFDDGTTPDAYVKGKYELLEFKNAMGENSSGIDLISVVGANCKGTDRSIDFIVHNLEKAPKKVLVDEVEVLFSMSPKTQDLIINFQWPAGEKKNIKIEK